MLKKLNSQNLNTNFTLPFQKQVDKHVKTNKSDSKLLIKGMKWYLVTNLFFNNAHFGFKYKSKVKNILSRVKLHTFDCFIF